MSDPAATIPSLYDRQGKAWDRLRRRAPFVEEGWFARFAELLPDSAEVLDLGCGSGYPVAAWLLGRGHGITGIDVSATMIGLATDRFPGQSWQVADMTRLDLGRRFDGLIAWDSFFHLDFDAQRSMFPIFAAHSRRGAPLMFTSGTGHGTAIGSLEGEPLFHASLAPDEYLALLEAHGFERIAHVERDSQAGERTVWLARRL